MAERIARGPQGLGGNTSLDSGTLATTRMEPPGVSLSYTWDPKAKEGLTKSIAIKRADAYGVADGRVVGKVYFAVDIDKIYFDDILGLSPLINSLKDRVDEGFEIRLLCVGFADYRWTSKYNLDLGKRRANNVSEFIKRYVLGSPTASNSAFTVETPLSLGESEAAQPTKGGRRPSEWTMGKDRVVVIQIDKNGLLPPVTLAFEGPAFYAKPLEPMEINAGGKIATHVVTRKDEAKDLQAERNDQRLHARGKQDMAEDPLRALVEIKVKYVERIVAGKKLGELHYDAVDVKTGRILFSLPKPALKDSNGDFDYKTIYLQLRGPHSNITERCRSLFGRKITKKR